MDLAAVLGRHRLLRSYYDLVCHSAPLFLALSNHEGEWGNQLRGTEDELPIRATRLRKQYFSQDGNEWGQAAAKGTFPAEPLAQKVTLARPARAQYLRSVVLSDHGASNSAVIAELDVN